MAGQSGAGAPKVSLLVPVYNVERYLPECLDSIAAQTLDDIEIICINDGSTDSSRDIIQRYQDRDPRFRVIDKPNSGYGASMNMGLEAATGDFVGIVESDDWIEPDMLESLYRIAVENDVQVVKSNFYFYWSEPELKDELFEFVEPEMCDYVLDPYEEYEIFYSKPSIWSAIYRRDFLNENGIRFLETPGASYQDTAFNFKVWLAASRVWCTCEAFLHYRQDNEKSSVNSPGKVYCVCDEYAEMSRYLEERFPQKTERMWHVLAKMRYDSYMWNFERLSEELQPEWLERFASDMSADRDSGRLDYSFFEPWKPRDCELIMDDPKLFAAMRRWHDELEARGETSSKVAAVKYYKSLGGMKWVLRMFKHSRG